MKKVKTVVILILSILLLIVLGGCQAAEPGDASDSAGASSPVEPDGSGMIDDRLVLQDAPDLPRPAWGDDVGGRSMYTQADAADGALGDMPVLNSLIDSPIQDARCFVYAQKVEADGSLGTLARSFAVSDGDVYRVYMYIQNDNSETVSEGTRAALSIPLTSENGTSQLVGSVYSDNATTHEVWSTLVLSGEKDFQINYSYGSAQLINAAHTDGFALDDALVTKAASERGVAIGYDEMNGSLPGGKEYRALISVQIQIVSLLDTSPAAKV